MPAKKNNQHWRSRRRHGRKKLFATPSDLWIAACQYFEWCEANPLKAERLFSYRGEIVRAEIDKARPFTIKGLCLFLGCNTAYFRQQKDEGFSTIIERIKLVIYNQKFEGAAVGIFDARLISRELILSKELIVGQDS